MAASTTPTLPSRSSPSSRTRAEQCRLNARAKSERARQATLEALAALLREGRAVTKAAVARRAGVSTVFVRGHPDLLQHIEAAARRHTTAPPPAPGDAAKDQVIAALRRRLEEQRQQLAAKDTMIREQRAEIARLYGKLASREG